ncbi:MAG: hypothetical protein WBS24_13200 [Terriglobales bacterium]
MADEKELQRRIQKVGELVSELDRFADPAARAAARELVQSLMDLHSAGLERILKIVFEADAKGGQLIDQLGDDSLVGSLLILYGLHPLDFETRVRQKVEQIRPRVFKMGAEIGAIEIDGNAIRLRARIEGHACGSTSKTIQATIEDAIYEAAPDLSSLQIEGLTEPTASGFVAVGSLIGSSVPVSVSPVHAMPQAEGMD